MRNGALLANPSNCRAYIECQQNLRLDRECGIGEFFEVTSGACLSDFTVDCGDRGVSSRNDDVAAGNVRPWEILRNVTKLNFTFFQMCLRMPSGTRISHPQECRKYYECQNSQRIDVTCPPNQSFDLSTNQCIASNLVNCGSRRNLDNIVPPNAASISKTFI